MIDLQIKIRTRDNIENAIIRKQEEIIDLKKDLKKANEDIFGIYEHKQGELDL